MLNSFGRVSNAEIYTWSILNTLPVAAVDSMRLSMCLNLRKRALKKLADKAKK